MITFGQLFLAVSIPTFVALVGVILNQISNSGLRTEFKTDIAGLRTEVKTDIAGLRTEVKTDIAKLDTKLESLRTEVASELRAIRGDINTITKMYGEHGERIAKVEAR